MLKLSKLTVFLAIFIVISASFMRQVLDFLNYLLGRNTVIISFAIIQIAGGGFFLYFLINKKLGWLKLMVIFIVLSLGMLLVWKIKIFAERIHILEYGVLGYLAAKDLKVAQYKFNIFVAFFFTLLVGVIDELFQKILPYRYFDFRDIVFNSLGGAWGVFIKFLIGYNQQD